MNFKTKQILAIIKIRDFPSRNEIISFFKSFLPQKTSPQDYNIINKSNQILFIMKDHNLAYNFTEKFNKKIIDNPLYSKTECSISFKKVQRSSSTLNLGGINTKLYAKKNNKSFSNIFTNKNHPFISDYERAHWAHIKDRAGIIENDSPYIDNQSREYIERKQNEKKWIDKKNFNIFIGKASSVDISHSNEIKNYVGRTPSLPPVLYQFRSPQKSKWVGNGDFHLY